MSTHVQSVHKGIYHNCNTCEYKETTKYCLTVHMQALQEGIRFKYDLCDYSVTQKNSLKIHQKSRHKKNATKM